MYILRAHPSLNKSSRYFRARILLIVVYICDLLYAYCTRTRLTLVLWKTDNAMAATRSLMKRADTLLFTLATEQVNE